jgi:hypothetical protein
MRPTGVSQVEAEGIAGVLRGDDHPRLPSRADRRGHASPIGPLKVAPRSRHGHDPCEEAGERARSQQSSQPCGPCAEPRGRRHQQRHERREEVLRQQEVRAEGAHGERYEDCRHSDVERQQPAAPLFAVGSRGEQEQCGPCQGRRHGYGHGADRATGLPQQEALPGIQQSLAEIDLADPIAAPPGHALVNGERQQHGPCGHDRRGRCQRSAPVAGAHHQPQRLRRQHDHRKVMGRQRKRRRDRPSGETSAGRTLESLDEEQKGEGGQEDQQRVGPGLLRVPHQHRVGRHERRGDQPCAPGDEDRRGTVGDRHGRGAGQRGERAQPHLAGAHQLRPAPGDDVVQRGCGLVVHDYAEGLEQTRPDHHPGGPGLVVAEALDVERRESEDRGEGREREDPALPTQRSHRASSQRSRCRNLTDPSSWPAFLPELKTASQLERARSLPCAQSRNREPMSA